VNSQYYNSVLQSTTKYHSILLEIVYSILQRTTPYYKISFRTTKSHSVVQKYCSLLRFYMILQSLTPYKKVFQSIVLLRTAKYDTNTSVLQRIYYVLDNTTQ